MWCKIVRFWMCLCIGWASWTTTPFQNNVCTQKSMAIHGWISDIATFLEGLPCTTYLSLLPQHMTTLRPEWGSTRFDYYSHGIDAKEDGAFHCNCPNESFFILHFYKWSEMTFKTKGWSNMMEQHKVIEKGASNAWWCHVYCCFAKTILFDEGHAVWCKIVK